MRALTWMLHKDLLVEWRARAHAIGLAAFAGTTLLLFSFAVGPDTAALRQHAGAYLWLSLLLSSTLLLERSFTIEFQSGALDLLLLIPTPPGAIFLGKALANTLQLGVLAAVAVPLTIGLFDAPLVGSPGLLALTLALGAAGLAAPGTLYAALTARADARQLLLPLLLFPLVVPCLLAAVKATTLLMLGDPMGQLGSWLPLLVCFDVLFWTLCAVLFSRVVED